MPADLKTFEKTQADPAHCRSASFAAAGPNANHTGITGVVSGGSSTAPIARPTGSAAQLAERKYETAKLGKL